jgi:hypothetical protein
VYQAYRSQTARFAVENQFFGEGFSLNRMTWIKTNFLWMMYRSNWGRSEGQEAVLAIRIRRGAFDQILAKAVHTSYEPSVYDDEQTWRQAVKSSDVRLQWDPDRNPTGEPLQRRAIQLGLRGGVARRYARDWILRIDDISDFVAQQREIALGSQVEALFSPVEKVYTVESVEIAKRLKLDHGGCGAIS